ncbi:hemerythrin domain-containing protein [Streptomyces sp. NPDC048718]|uniref:hemerythrin domain-containing protein n=1 Tax=Streptomyces sp. NPDC048718 TaxID=3365587 RepID=UPI0037230009
MASRNEGDRVVALSLQLSQAHEELLRRLREIRSHLGRRRLDDDVLLTHCLAFCAALTSHHEGEDGGLFAELVRVRPDLAPTIEKLVEDHGFISSILSRVGELADRAVGSQGPTLEAIGGELDGLAAIMESHFGYEERAIGQALDSGVAEGGWSDRVFRFAGETDSPSRRRAAP